ncbi:hypothetical protein LEMLEM_LOCUS5382 [Lemmus lemmus]
MWGPNPDFLHSKQALYHVSLHIWAPGKAFLTSLFSTSLKTFGLHPRRGTRVCSCLYEKHGEAVSILTLSKVQESGQLAHFYFFCIGPVIEPMFFLKFLFGFLLCVSLIVLELSL